MDAAPSPTWTSTCAEAAERICGGEQRGGRVMVWTVWTDLSYSPPQWRYCQNPALGGGPGADPTSGSGQRQHRPSSGLPGASPSQAEPRRERRPPWRNRSGAACTYSYLALLKSAQLRPDSNRCTDTLLAAPRPGGRQLIQRDGLPPPPPHAPEEPAPQNHRSLQAGRQQDTPSVT